MRLYLRIVLSLAIILTVFASSKVSAQIKGEGLIVTPTRVELDQKTRSVSLSLINNGKQTSTYRIQTINSRMSETGERENVKGEPHKGELFADKMVRFAPRHIRLKPGEQQTVRVMARIPGDIEKGEYRTGLSFQWVPEPGEPQIRNNSNQDGISVQIDFSFGVTIPVIIRNDELQATGKISQIKLTTNNSSEKCLEITVDREGSRSLYGDFSAIRIAEDGKEDLLATVRGVAVYVPNPRRIYTMKLPDNKTGIIVPGKDKLRVEYREPVEHGAKLIAEKTILIQ